LAGTNEAQAYQAVAVPSNGSFDVSRETASQLQDISDEDVVNSQQQDGSACDNVSTNSDLKKPSLNMKSRFKFLSGMVNRTLAVKRRVQVVNLKSVVHTHSSWSSTSQGYQNLFEFGTLAHSACLFVFASSFMFKTHTKTFSCLHAVVPCGVII
jgi:hypothetical protein